MKKKIALSAMYAVLLALALLWQYSKFVDGQGVHRISPVWGGHLLVSVTLIGYLYLLWLTWTDD